MSAYEIIGASQLLGSCNLLRQRFGTLYYYSFVNFQNAFLAIVWRPHHLDAAFVPSGG